MKCPHCLDSFHDSGSFTFLRGDNDGHWAVRHQTCPSCSRAIVELACGVWHAPSSNLIQIKTRALVYPRGISRTPVPSDVPNDIAEDYKEACLVLNDSPKASAALSRRCLQNTLRNAAGVKQGDLADEIQQVLDSGKLPTQLAESIDAIRNIGNFSAHPMKSKVSGDILPVEPHEAEWNLDVLEALFDFYYVQPAIIAKKRAALNAKLGSAGKPPMK
jgi:hypothetical protein